MHPLVYLHRFASRRITAFGFGAKIMLTIMMWFVVAGWDLIQGSKCINTDLHVVISIGVMTFALNYFYLIIR